MAMLWAVLQNVEDANALTAGLIRVGFAVSSGSPNGGSTWVRDFSTLLAHRLSHPTKSKASDISDSVKEVLNSARAQWIALIVLSDDMTAVWSPSNIKRPQPEQPPTQPSATPPPSPGVNRFELIDEDKL